MVVPKDGEKPSKRRGEPNHKLDAMIRSSEISFASRVPGSPGAPPIQIALNPPDAIVTDDFALWVAIRNRTDAIRSDRYGKFINRVLCRPNGYAGTPVCGADAKHDKSYGGRSRDIGAMFEARRDELLVTASGYG